MPSPEFVTREVTITLKDLYDLFDDDSSYEAFLDKLSYLHSNTDLLINITIDEVQPMKLSVMGDVRVAKQFEEYV